MQYYNVIGKKNALTENEKAKKKKKEKKKDWKDKCCWQ
jgi:hypothetical protein